MTAYRTLAFLLSVAGLLPGTQAQAEASENDIVIGHRRIVHSKVLGEDRKINIYTPQSYNSGNHNYPILILLDGDGHFHHATGIMEVLAKNGGIPEMIVIGVTNTQRTRDLTPYANEGEPGGGANNFLQFLTDELTPWIDKNYRTRPLRFLVGHSLGGLFAVHTLTKKPDFFRGLIAISPSMQWAKQRSTKEFETWLETKPNVTASLYMTAGNEGMGLLGGTLKISGSLSEHAPATLQWKFDHHPLETHNSVVHRSIYDGMEFIFKGWRVSDPLAIYDEGGLEAVASSVEKSRAPFGYDFTIPPSTMFFLVATLLMQDRHDEAIAIFVGLDPDQYTLPGYYLSYLSKQVTTKAPVAVQKKFHLHCLEIDPHNELARTSLQKLGVEPPPPPAKMGAPIAAPDPTTSEPSNKN